MIKRTIELPEEIGIRRAGGTCVVKVENLSDYILGQLIEMAIGNKVGDAPSGVKAALGGVFHDGTKATPDDELSKDDLKIMADKASEMMTKVRDSLYAGEWKAARVASGDPLQRFREQVIRSMLKAKPDGEFGKRFAKAKGPDERAEVIAECLAAQSVEGLAVITAKAEAAREKAHAEAIKRKKEAEAIAAAAEDEGVLI